MRQLDLLLFDVDGVLLHPKGYEDALKDTLDLFTDLMGVERAGLRGDEIAFFESRGITNEWLSGAIALSEYVRRIAWQYPELITPSLRETLSQTAKAGIHIERPDFIKVLTQALFETGPEITETPDAILRNVKNQTPKIAHPLIAEILQDVRPPAPFADLFQNHTLGKVAFEQTYGRKAFRSLTGYLETRDESNLSPSSVNLLHQLIHSPDYGIAIYTARPSLPPIDLTEEERAVVDSREHPPEGDMVKTLTGLPKEMPLISGGRMSWLAMRDGRHPGDYIKPSPLHGLSTIAAAFLRKERSALLSASLLWREGIEDVTFQQLKEKDIRVTVFEDSPSGIYAITRAVERLSNIGFSITGRAIGISISDEKKKMLTAVAEAVFADINEALAYAVEL